MVLGNKRATYINKIDFKIEVLLNKWKDIP